MSERDLRSTTYDGVTITTRWEDWARMQHTPARYVRPAQEAHAEHHRNRVRSYLKGNDLARLLRDEWWLEGAA